MAKKTIAPKEVSNDSVAKEVSKIVEPKTFKFKVNLKSENVISRGEFKDSEIEKNPDVFHNTITQAQRYALNELNDIRSEFEPSEFDEIKWKIEKFS